MTVTEDFQQLERAINYVLMDRSCAAHVRFAEACGRCYGTGSTDEGRRAHPNESDRGCEKCGGTGRVNEQDGYAALRRLHSTFLGDMR